MADQRDDEKKQPESESSAVDAVDDAIGDLSEDTPTADAVSDSATPVAGVESVADEPKAKADADVADEDVDVPSAVRGVLQVGADETTPGDPSKSPAYSPDMAETWEGPMSNKTSPRSFIVVLAVCLVISVIGFALMPSDLRTDTLSIFAGNNIIEEREMRERARVEAERQAFLDAAPKYGTIEIVTIPSNMMVEAEGQDLMVYPGTRRDLVLPTRSRVTYEDISVTEPFTFTIRGEGVYEDQTETIQPHGDSESLWVQNMSGQYVASVTYNLEPLEDAARELAWRRAYRPDAARDRGMLTGTINVTSEPEGALVLYNRIPVRNEEGEPMLTPATFSQHPAPPDAEDQEMRDVFLSREGIRVELFMEDKAISGAGVYLHQYRCERVEGANWPAEDAEDPDFYGLCNYVYDLELPIMEIKPEEEEEEEGEEGEDGEESEEEGEEAEEESEEE